MKECIVILSAYNLIVQDCSADGNAYSYMLYEATAGNRAKCPIHFRKCKSLSNTGNHLVFYYDSCYAR